MQQSFEFVSEWCHEHVGIPWTCKVNDHVDDEVQDMMYKWQQIKHLLEILNPDCYRHRNGRTNSIFSQLFDYLVLHYCEHAWLLLKEIWRSIFDREQVVEECECNLQQMKVGLVYWGGPGWVSGGNHGSPRMWTYPLSCALSGPCLLVWSCGCTSVRAVSTFLL